MKLSQFGRKFASDSAIVNLMEDLGQALNVNPDLLFLGGGNPARVPAFEKEVAKHLEAIARDPDSVNKLVGVYQSPKGSEEFIENLTGYINQELGWGISSDNIAITNGSQSAFFILINILTGKTDAHPEARQLVFPMMPEYLGYSDQSSEHHVFRSFLPQIELHGETRFKYHVDFNAFELKDSDAGLCVSRPTNPTGNVLSTSELEHLTSIAKKKKIPFIIDCAYGDPFPGIVYDGDNVFYDPANIYVLSCSKLGLPGARTGIVIAPKPIIDQIVKVNTIMSLANGNFGPQLVNAMLRSGDLSNICQNTLLPFYRERRDFAIACIEKYFKNTPYRMHEPEGAFFIWLWFPELGISSTELYERMKNKGVLIMDGSHFFFGVDSDWDHAKQCIRLTYCQDKKVIEEAVKLIAEELKLLS